MGAISIDDISVYPIGVATASLGMAPSATLDRKFAALQKAGFVTCELGFSAYVDWVRARRPQLPASTCPAEWSEGGEPDPSDEAIWQAFYEEAPNMIAYAKSFGLTILVLQPLNQFDGWPVGSERAEWVGSNDYAEANAPDEKTAEDLKWLAQLGAKQSPPVKIAYESWCFSKRVASWEHTWKLVQMGTDDKDHPNLGLCLDTAHFPLAPDYGWDPTTGEGWTNEQYAAMIERMKKVPGDKIFYVELSDVLKPVVPLGKGSPYDEWREKAQSPRGDSFVWAICGRPVPLIGRDAGRQVQGDDDLGGARVVESLKAILSTGFKGPLMYEVFEALSMEVDDANLPDVYAEACAKSARLLQEAVKA